MLQPRRASQAAHAVANTTNPSTAHHHHFLLQQLQYLTRMPSLAAPPTAWQLQLITPIAPGLPAATPTHLVVRPGTGCHHHDTGPAQAPTSLTPPAFRAPQLAGTCAHCTRPLTGAKLVQSTSIPLLVVTAHVVIAAICNASNPAAGGWAMTGPQLCIVDRSSVPVRLP